MVVVKRSGADLSIAVHDDGKGVPKRARDHDLGAFERGTHHLDANIPGSGIGGDRGHDRNRHGGSAFYRRSEEWVGRVFGPSCPVAPLTCRFHHWSKAKTQRRHLAPSAGHESRCRSPWAKVSFVEQVSDAAEHRSLTVDPPGRTFATTRSAAC